MRKLASTEFTEGEACRGIGGSACTADRERESLIRRGEVIKVQS